jgi:hypothetical protein
MEGHGWANNLMDLDQNERLKLFSFSIDGPWSALKDEDIPKLSNKEKNEKEKEYLEKVKNKYQSRMENFKNFHVDKPIVDYIRVFDNHRRQRIAIALYEYGAKWMAKKGMKLYASGIQSDEAQAAWEWLKKNRGANIGREKSSYDKIRTFLSYL